MRFCTVAPTPTSGLGVFAELRIPVGTVVLSEECVAFGGVVRFNDYCCRWCWTLDATNPNPLNVVCPGCAVRYCSHKCREVDALHGQACDALAAMRSTRPAWGRRISPEDAAFLQLMLPVLCGSPERRQALLSLSAAGQRVDDNVGEILWGLADAFCESSDVERDEFERLAAVERTNCVSIGALTPLGVLSVGRAVFLGGSRFNHACRPNVVRVAEGRRMHFITSRNVEAGEELCVSYVPPRAEQKRETLQKDYGFVCKCGHCDDDEPSDACDECGGETLRSLCVHHHRLQILRDMKK